jgi:hypothetical protein
MTEQEARLEQLQDQLQAARAYHAELERALAASTAESAATIAALKSSMQCASSEALELAQRRHATYMTEQQSKFQCHALSMPAALRALPVLRLSNPQYRAPTARRWEWR